MLLNFFISQVFLYVVPSWIFPREKTEFTFGNRPRDRRVFEDANLICSWVVVPVIPRVLHHALVDRAHGSGMSVHFSDSSFLLRFSQKSVTVFCPVVQVFRI